MRVDHDQGDLKTEPKPSQLSQEDSQMNIIADKTRAITCTIITMIHNVHGDLSLY